MLNRTRLTTATALATLFVALLACKKKSAPTPSTTSTSTAAATPTPGSDLSGNYTISAASNPGGGGGYKGSVDISSAADAYVLKWTLTGQPGYSGVGIDQDGILGVGWGTGTKYGVVVYKVNGGTLNGRWALSNATAGVGTETAVGPEGLNGAYKVEGKSPKTGSDYKGTLTITPAGSVHKVGWALTSGEKYSGVGILEGSTFVVGWGIGGSAGVVLYSRAGTGLSGKWAMPTSTSLGSETLAKN